MLAHARWIVPAVLLAGLPSPSPAQPDAAKRYAVLVGVNEYDHPKLTPLKYAVNDVTELGQFLDKADYACTLLTADAARKNPSLAPTRANIEARTRDVLARCHKGDTVLIAMAGHGVQFEGKKDSYFCPADGKPFPDQSNTLVSLSKLYDDLDRSNAGVKVVFVDACRDDPAAGRGVDADNAPKPPRGVACLFSCSAGERAFEHQKLGHGVFFHHVLKGLSGEAADRKGRVTFAGLAGYVSQEVAETVPGLVGNGAKQSPNLKAEYSNEPVLVAAAKAVGVVPEKAPDKAPEWKDLLAGDKLDAWEILWNGDWSVRNGVLTAGDATKTGLGMLATRADYKNFEMTLEYRLSAKANSGVYLRLPREPKRITTDNIEVQFQDDDAFPGADTTMTGGVYNKIAPNPLLNPRPNVWHSVAIRAVGNRLVVSIDGTQCLDSTGVPWDQMSGRIGLQNNRGRIDFRNVRVREITPGEAR